MYFIVWGDGCIDTDNIIVLITENLNPKCFGDQGRAPKEARADESVEYIKYQKNVSGSR